MFRSQAQGNPELTNLLGEKCIAVMLIYEKLENLIHPVFCVNQEAGGVGSRGLWCILFFMVGVPPAVQSMILSVAKRRQDYSSRNVHRSVWGNGALRSHSCVCKSREKIVWVSLGMKVDQVKGSQTNPDLRLFWSTINLLWCLLDALFESSP